MYYLLVRDIDVRQRVLDAMRAEGIHSVFHYVPLHSSPAGQRFGRTVGDLAVTDRQSTRLIRLPMWNGLESAQLDRVLAVLQAQLAR